MAKKTRKPGKEYDLKSLKHLRINADKLVLGCDPGSANYGICLVGLLPNQKIKVYANSVLMRPLNDLINFNDNRVTFLSEIGPWMQHSPDGIIAERFQTRGNGGPLIELVSAMLGLLGAKYPRTKIKLTVASAWKNKLQRRFNVDLKEIYPQVNVQPHQLDAALIGVYGLEAGLGKELDYDLWDIVSQVEQTSLIGTRK